MNIEKLKNYNQKILAIIGTIVILFGIVGLLLFVTFAISEYRRANYYEEEKGILSDEKIEELQKENKREQVISYEIPKLIDSLQAIYIIPVLHKTLNEKEDMNGMLNLISSSPSSTIKIDRRYTNEFYGEYNNVLLYSQKTATTQKLFNKRVNFDKIDVEYFEDDILLLLKVAEKDTHKDGVINLLDNNSLYIYSLKEKKMRKVGNTQMNIYKYTFLDNSKDLIIQLGIDKNGDGMFSNYNEPVQLKKYVFANEELVDVVDKNTHATLQKMLEGTINN